MTELDLDALERMEKEAGFALPLEVVRDGNNSDTTSLRDAQGFRIPQFQRPSPFAGKAGHDWRSAEMQFLAAAANAAPALWATEARRVLAAHPDTTKKAPASAQIRPGVRDQAGNEGSGAEDTLSA